MSTKKDPQFIAVYYSESVALRGFEEMEKYIYKTIISPPGPELLEKIEETCRQTEISGVLTRGSLAWYLHKNKIPIPIFDVRYDIPTIFRLVRERNRLDQAFYLGDTQGDYDAAGEAEMPFLHAAYGFGRVPEGTPAIGDIRKLPEWAEKFFKG